MVCVTSDLRFICLFILYMIIINLSYYESVRVLPDIPTWFKTRNPTIYIEHPFNFIINKPVPGIYEITQENRILYGYYLYITRKHTDALYHQYIKDNQITKALEHFNEYYVNVRETENVHSLSQQQCLNDYVQIKGILTLQQYKNAYINYENNIYSNHLNVNSEFSIRLLLLPSVNEPLSTYSRRIVYPINEDQFNLLKSNIPLKGESQKSYELRQVKYGLLPVAANDINYYYDLNYVINDNFQIDDVNVASEAQLMSHIMIYPESR